jgi:uncharacterized protein (DUF1697 family)
VRDFGDGDLRGSPARDQCRPPPAGLDGRREEGFRGRGNVLLRSSLSAAKLAPRLEKELERRLGHDIAVLVRTRADLARLIEKNPFPDEKDGKKLHVAFLESTPQRTRAGRLEPERLAPDAFRVFGREVYLHYPKGYGRSKLTNDYLERQLGVRSTMRNWKTVSTLAERAGGSA